MYSYLTTHALTIQFMVLKTKANHRSPDATDAKIAQLQMSHIRCAFDNWDKKLEMVTQKVV